MKAELITPNIIGRVFSDVRAIETSDKGIIVTGKNSNQTLLSYSKIHDIPIITGSFLGKKITLNHDGNLYTFPFLKKVFSANTSNNIENIIIKNISRSIAIANEIFVNRALNEYLRDSSIEKIKNSIEPILTYYNNSKYLWQSKLSKESISSLLRFDEYFPLTSGKDKLRVKFESERLVSGKKFFDSIESNPLTEQQRLAVIRNNDLNLVLAAAGTGKTSVIVAKSLDLIQTKKVSHNNILILAYNKSAAIELKERVELRAEIMGAGKEATPSVYTFHALGRKVLNDSNIRTYLSDFATDPIKLQMWVTEWIANYAKSSSASLRKIIKLEHQPINPFDFKTKKEYDEYIKDNEFRTLQGERVKGYQELLIANWFFMNSVEYGYEDPYVTKRRIEVGFDYRPDFHIKGTDIYLEHFGVDRKGNTRSGIIKEEYNDSIIEKRELHQENKTVLLETFHYDWVEGNLEKKLSILMDKQKVKTYPKTDEEIFKALNSMGFIEDNAIRYLKCLQAIRVEMLDDKSILNRLKENNIIRAEEYTDFLKQLYVDYTNELESQKRIDFDDMIIMSANAIKSGHFIPKWSHILVDEFQDISKARMLFLQTLIEHGPCPILTVVGDDWQSIYRFSGGKLELTTRFDDLVGKHTLTKLEKTFRYNNSIADTAGMFIMQNPEQYKKEVTTETKVKKPQVYLLDSIVNNKNNSEERILQIIETIRSNDKTGSIAILARYRHLLESAKITINSRLTNANIKYWTFHGSKGLESDYCILFGFIQGKHGFPNSNKENAVTEALLPSLDIFPHSEERRLFYVALTRARKKSYLIADPMSTSSFINELIAPKYKLHIASKAFEDKYREIFKCPLCTDGYFRLMSGKFGDFYSCTSGSTCRSNPRICEKCGAPAIDMRSECICNNSNCRNKINICERCGRPMEVRNGKFGKFLGCTGYGIKDDQCRHTRKII